MRTRTIRSRRTLVVGTLAAMSLVAAACGGDDDGASTPATDPAPTTTAPAPTEPPVTEPDNDDMDDMNGDDMAMGTQFGPACSAVPEDGPGSFGGMAQDPAGTAASNNPLLTTLVSAVAAADLVDTLNSEGPFTIFAPVNDAFDAIDPDTLDTVLGDVDLLTSILTYHVIAGDNFTAADLATEGMATTVNGAELTFGSDGTSVNDVDVLCSDVTVANATVHIIGEVLLPPEG